MQSHRQTWSDSCVIALIIILTEYFHFADIIIIGPEMFLTKPSTAKKTNAPIGFAYVKKKGFVLRKLR